MKEHWQAIHTIIDSVAALKDNQYHSVNSPEIKESANNFEKSLKPCLQELSESSIRLQSLIADSLEELAQAEDIWHSKERIANSCTSTTWEELTKLTGYSVKLKQLKKNHKSFLLEKSTNKWQQIIEELKQVYFIDPKKGMKSGIGWNEKSQFIKEIRTKLQYYSLELDKIIVEQVTQLFQELYFIEEQRLTYYLDLFDNIKKDELYDEFEKISQDIDAGMNNINKIKGVHMIKLPLQFDATLIGWQKKFGELSWEEIIKFENGILEASKGRIITIFSNRITLAHKIVERLIEFHHNLLEKQNRYRQETAEQRLAEKAWIDQQKETLQKMQLEFQNITSINS